MVAATIIGLGVQRPLAWLTVHQGLNVLLAALVFATAIAELSQRQSGTYPAAPDNSSRSCRRGHGPARAGLGRISSRSCRIIPR